MPRGADRPRASGPRCEQGRQAGTACAFARTVFPRESVCSASAALRKAAWRSHVKLGGAHTGGPDILADVQMAHRERTGGPPLEALGRWRDALAWRLAGLARALDESAGPEEAGQHGEGGGLGTMNEMCWRSARTRLAATCTRHETPRDATSSRRGHRRCREPNHAAQAATYNESARMLAAEARGHPAGCRSGERHLPQGVLVCDDCCSPCMPQR